MKDWFLFSLLTLLFWGLWAFFPRFAVDYIQPRSLLLYQVVGIVIAFMAIMAFGGVKIETHPVGIFIGVLSGACGIIGSYFYNFALQKGKAPIVLSITALYPLVAIVLFMIFFRDGITLKQVAGIVFALGAMVLLSH